MKTIINLTSANNSEVIVGNIPNDKILTLRGAFTRGKGFPNPTQGSVLYFRYAEDGDDMFFTSMIINDYQNQMNPDGFNFPNRPGKELLVKAINLQPGQEIYLEIEYEILDA